MSYEGREPINQIQKNSLFINFEQQPYDTSLNSNDFLLFINLISN